MSQCIAEYQPVLPSQNLQFSVKNYFLMSLQSKQLTGPGGSSNEQGPPANTADLKPYLSWVHPLLFMEL